MAKATAGATHARIVHRTPGRVRLRVPRHHGRRHLQQIAERLVHCPGVSSVQANERTGSLLIRHHTSLEKLLGYARSNALFLIGGEASAMRSFSALVTDSMGQLNRWLMDASDDQLTLPVLISVVFLLMAGTQILRGEFRGATVHLLLFALHAASVNQRAGAEAGEAAADVAEEAAGELA